MRLRVEVEGPEGSATLQETVDRVRAAVAALASAAVVETRNAERLRVVIDGRELKVLGAENPPEWLVEAGILRALRPHHFLFLCVANSARSQMAEGIARSLAPAGVTVSSAGSAPTRVRPQAIAVLREQGIDISHHTSKAVASIDSKTVEVVVTLCGEEECPVFFGKALRVHWGLPDPANVRGSEEEQLRSFREVRDEIRRRIQILFADWKP